MEINKSLVDSQNQPIQSIVQNDEQINKIKFHRSVKPETKPDHSISNPQIREETTLHPHDLKIDRRHSQAASIKLYLRRNLMVI